MPVGVVEIHAAPAIVVVDLACAFPRRVGPIVEPPLTNSGENFVELLLRKQDGIVLLRDAAFLFMEVERDFVAEFNDEEWSKDCRP